MHGLATVQGLIEPSATGSRLARRVGETICVYNPRENWNERGFLCMCHRVAPHAIDRERVCADVKHVRVTTVIRDRHRVRGGC